MSKISTLGSIDLELGALLEVVSNNLEGAVGKQLNRQLEIF